MNGGITPLFLAALKGHLEDCRWLTQNGADVDPPNKVSALLFLSCKEEGLTRKNDVMKYGETPFFIAAGEGHLEVCKWRRQNGADMNAPI